MVLKLFPLSACRDEGDEVPRGDQEEEGSRHPQDHRALVIILIR